MRFAMPVADRGGGRTGREDDLFFPSPSFFCQDSSLPERTQCPTVFSQCVHIVTMLKRSNLTVWRWFYTVVSFFTECSHSDALFHTVNWWFTVLKRSNLTLSQCVHTVFTVCSHCVSHCGTLCSFQQGYNELKNIIQGHLSVILHL